MCKKIRRKLCFVLGIAAVTCLLLVILINGVIVARGNKRILQPSEAVSLQADCILVLGAGVRDDGSPSHMLEDRLKTGMELYNMDVSPKLLMSGDHGRIGYNEVGVMKRYAVQNGADECDVFMDHAGFSTYESLYRLRDIFQADKVIIVTQKYHLYRALYIAEQLGIEAYGVHADLRPYRGQIMREVREIAARIKDALWCILEPSPKYLGEVIPISGDGNATNDDGYEAVMAQSS